MEHSQIILNIINEQGTSAYKISKTTGISESLFSKWRKNPTSEISSCNLVKIADYLDCSVDYLLGRTESPQGYSYNSFSDSNNIALGEGAQVHIESSDNMKNEILIEIAKMIDEMTLQEKGRFIDYLYKFEK